MTTLLTVVYVFVCLFLILVVLLQAGKGGGMGSAFGGSSGAAVFGGAGASNFLTRLTVASATLFMLLSATLAYLSSGSDKSLEAASLAIGAEEKAKEQAAKAKEQADNASKSGATDTSDTFKAETAGGAESTEPRALASEHPDSDPSGVPSTQDTSRQAEGSGKVAAEHLTAEPGVGSGATGDSNAPSEAAGQPAGKDEGKPD